MIDVHRQTHRRLAWLGTAAVVGLGLAGSGVLAQPISLHGVASSADAIAWDRALDRAQRVNLNTADGAALERLPGIGPSMAQRIIAHRLAAGPFRMTDELQRVPGIGPKTYEALQEYVTAE